MLCVFHVPRGHYFFDTASVYLSNWLNATLEKHFDHIHGFCGIGYGAERYGAVCYAVDEVNILALISVVLIIFLTATVMFSSVGNTMIKSMAQNKR